MTVTISRVAGVSGVCVIAGPLCELPPRTLFSLSGVPFSLRQRLEVASNNKHSAVFL